MGFNMTETTGLQDLNNTGSTNDRVVTIMSSLNYPLFVITSWVLVNMTVYGVRVCAKKPFCTGSKLFALCYIGVLVNFSRIAILIVMSHLNLIPGGLKKCSRMRRTSNGMAALNLVFTCGLLWFRQKLFHSDKLLKGESYNKYVSILSWLALMMLFASPALVICIAVISDNVGYDDKYCVFQIEREDWIRGASWALYAIIILMQISLLFLLLFPMAYMRMKSGLFMQKASRKDKLLSTVKRCFTCGLIAIVTDVILLTLISFLPKNPGYPVLVGDTIANIDLVINDFCIIATFSKAPQILTGALYKLWRPGSSSSKRTPTGSDQRTSTNDV